MEQISLDRLRELALGFAHNAGCYENSADPADCEYYATCRDTAAALGELIRARAADSADEGQK